jgi:hypothetical protein
MSEHIKPKRQYRRRQKSTVESETVLSASGESVPAASEPALSTTPAPAPVPLRLTASEIFQLRLAESEVRAATAEKESVRLRRLYYLALLDPKGTILAEEKRLAEKDRALREAQAKFSVLRERAGKRLGVDMNKAGVDVETGEVVVVPSA